MISNERPSPFRPRRPKFPQPQFPPRPPVDERTLSTEQVQVERKTCVFLLKENPRGRFLRIIEESAGKSNSIIVPFTGLEDFLTTLRKQSRRQPNCRQKTRRNKTLRHSHPEVILAPTRHR